MSQRETTVEKRDRLVALYEKMDRGMTTHDDAVWLACFLDEISMSLVSLSTGYSALLSHIEKQRPDQTFIALES